VSRSVFIDAAFEGLPDIALGGYSGGLLGRGLGPNCEGTLRRAIPTRTEVEIALTATGAELRIGDGIYAEGRVADLDIDLPSAVSVSDAEAASAHYPGFKGHFFPRCFCCGPARERPDGLRIFPGPVDGAGVMAALWTPAPDHSDGGRTPPLDCPGIWALIVSDLPGPDTKAVTARMAVSIVGPVVPDQPHVVMAWPVARDGNKLYAGAAIFSADGQPLAIAKQTMAITGAGVPLDPGSWLKADLTQ